MLLIGSQGRWRRIISRQYQFWNMFRRNRNQNAAHAHVKCPLIRRVWNLISFLTTNKMATGEKFQWSLCFPSSTELQHFNMAYGYVNGDGKMRFKTDVGSILQTNIHSFFCGSELTKHRWIYIESRKLHSSRGSARNLRVFAMTFIRILRVYEEMGRE